MKNIISLCVHATVCSSRLLSIERELFSGFDYCVKSYLKKHFKDTCFHLSEVTRRICIFCFSAMHTFSSVSNYQTLQEISNPISRNYHMNLRTSQLHAPLDLVAIFVSSIKDFQSEFQFFELI